MRIDEISQRVVWHASYTPGITEFNFLTHLGTWSAAAERALQKSFYPDMLEHPTQTPIFMYQVNMSQCRGGIKVLDDPDFGSPEDHIDHNLRFFPKKLRLQLENASSLQQTQEIFVDFGIDYLWYYNRVESPRSKSYVVLNPSCFKIVGVETISVDTLLLADPVMIDRFFHRGVWPAWWREKIKRHMARLRAQQTG